eukprot:Tbor_TRINITY_DN3915_c0_g1::TRINITY_DN3915_c0_g1_i1::g.847::m.847/K17732/PMPCB, MAS1; mitochondrial-processing peptidase subunit beta
MSVSFSTIVQRARPKANHIVTKQLTEVIGKIPPTTVSALGNGLRVAAERNPNAKFATIGLFMDAGTRYETPDQFGCCRVLEKCGFLGTNSKDRKQLSAAVEELGGHLHVETGREISQIHIKVAKEHVDKAVGLLADVTRNARLSDEDVKVAKEIVQTQRYETEERIDEILMDNLHRCAFDSTVAGLGNPLYGTEEAINKVDKTSLEKFRKANYNPRRFVLVGTGAVEHTALETSAKAHFGDMYDTPTPTLAEHRYVGGDIRLWNLRMKTVHLAWGFETCGAKCEDSIPLSLAGQVFGNFHRSQHEMGQHAMHRVLKTFSSQDHSTPTNTHFPEQAIETCNPFITQYHDTGLCGMAFAARPYQTGPGDAGSTQEIWQYTMAEWCRMTQKLMHTQELEQAKTNYKAQQLFNMDGSTNSCQDIGRQVIHYDRRIPLDEVYARVDDITVNNVQETLQHYFFARKPVYSMLGYTYPLANYDWSSMWTYKYWY